MKEIGMVQVKLLEIKKLVLNNCDLSPSICEDFYDLLDDIRILNERVEEIVFADTHICLYAVMNKEGKYFRNKGYGGYGKSWVDGLKKARIYSHPGPAKAQITYWAKTFPEYGIPVLVELRVKEMNIIDAK